MTTIAKTVASGATASFSIPFARDLDPTHIEVRLDGVVQVLNTDYTLSGDNVIISAGAPTAGTVVMRRRVTPVGPLTVFQMGSLDEDDLNASALQALYLAEEAKDQGDYVEAILDDVDADALLAASEQVATDAAQVAIDAAQVAADKITVAADKATVAADKATVASDKSTVSGYVTTASGYVTTIEGYRDEVEDDRVEVQGDKVIAAAAADAAVAAQVLAEAARDSTLAAYDTFDDRWLGYKASEPTLDNDGDALAVGAIFYHTGIGMKVWTGSVWEFAYVSGGAYAALANNGSDYNAATFRTNIDVYSTGAVDTLLTGKAAAVHTHTFASLTSKPTTLAGYGISDAAPSSHVGSGGTSHANAVASGAAGFMTGADKTKLDAVGTMANRAFTVSTSDPSGGANGDVWFKV